MLDSRLRPLIDPPLNRIGAWLARCGVRADWVTGFGLVLGLGAALAIWAGMWLAALVLVLASRLADGLDGAVARATGITDFGGYFDIVADFTFYAAIPLAFVLADPAANGAAGAFVLASFYINAASFLGFAILAEKARMHSDAQGRKSVYFSSGLLEGTETIVFFVALCLFPAVFAPLALIFGALCLLTAALRLGAAVRLFRPR
ncbi:MAG TPA: CDP-alcohol phosphatidyltransferase family protein [Paracoccus sp.]|nr:CDP-alcohol phosphatidyltransferase family protein [Paracoccus sp. (in: a-proteobacteria)]